MIDRNDTTEPRMVRTVKRDIEAKGIAREKRLKDMAKGRDESTVVNDAERVTELNDAGATADGEVAEESESPRKPDEEKWSTVEFLLHWRRNPWNLAVDPRLFLAPTMLGAAMVAANTCRAF